MAQRHLTLKYRPQTFSQVLGQSAVTKILSTAAEQKRVAPAYMFSGTRGVGKTTVARILAKAINCLEGPSREPCNECRICRQITTGTSLDVQEVDGASNTGVDNVRKLSEEIGYSPVECRYKMIIIDEAHMLSRSAFNALLKTLEEPPGHAVFVLATTEPHKFPATIVSRCQHYIFKRVPQKDLSEHLANVLEKEGIGYDLSALKLIAKKGGGSVRDSMSLLSQLLALGEGKISLELVKEVLGVAGNEMLQEFVRAVARKQSSSIVQMVQDLLDQGLDLVFFLQELTEAWRNLFLFKQMGDKALELMEMSPDEAKVWQELASELDLMTIHSAWQMTLEGQKKVTSSFEPGLAMELLLLNIAYLPELLPLEGLAAQGGKQSRSWAQSGKNKSYFAPQAEKKEEIKVQEKEAQPSPGKDGFDWNDFVRFAEKNCQGLLPMDIKQAKGELENQTLRLSCPEFIKSRLKDQESRIEQIAQEYFKKQIKLLFEEESKGNPQDLKKKVEERPLVKHCMEKFEANLIEIRPLK